MFDILLLYGDMMDIDPDSDPVQFVLDWYRATYNLSAMFEATNETLKYYEEDITRDKYWFETDDEVDEIFYRFKPQNQTSNQINLRNSALTQLDVETFTTWINQRRLSMVLFWINVDPVSRVMVHLFMKLSDSLLPDRKSFGALACHDWPQICMDKKIIDYPKVLIFQNGQSVKSYQSIFNANQLADTFLLLEASEDLEIKDETELTNFVNGKYLKLSGGRFLKTVTLGIFDQSDENSKDYELFQSVSKRLRGRYLLKWIKKNHVTTLNLHKSIFGNTDNNNQIIVINHFGKEPKFSRLFFSSVKEHIDTIAVDQIIDFIEKSSRPPLRTNILRLTHFSYPSIHRRFEQMLLLISPNPDESPIMQIFQNYQWCWSSSKNICSVLNSKTETTIALKLLKNFDLFLTDHDYLLLLLKNAHNQQLLKIDDDKISNKSIFLICRKCEEQTDDLINSKMIEDFINLSTGKQQQQQLSEMSTDCKKDIINGYSTIPHHCEL